MRTHTEKLIKHKTARKGVLVPLLEDLFQRPVEIETAEDVEWISELLRLMVERGERRREAPLFSPSQLSECLRYVYLLKHHKALEITRAGQVRVEPNFYFFNGNFLHLKWQFALYKLDRFIDDPKVFRLHGAEVPIISKRKDHGGTVDAIVSIYEQPFIVDVKGLNVRAFGQIAMGAIPPQYAMQLTDYGMLFNSQRNNTPRILNAILLSENKGGPDPKHLIALQETIIPIETHLPEIRRRLGVLREHEESNVIPEPECQSTKTIQFLGCPFRRYCREEVKANEQRRREAENRDAAKPQIAVPDRRRNHRSRRNSK